ncbi:GNAT family N-acetyltransferase [Patescibacteria group bacterium]|nr:GNAT family N-acetyltransferase [Patescibacteria group bacterium]MBU1890729.1 GNAT family N-acetyltransferase [Patescibacteria group bacterium]
MKTVIKTKQFILRTFKTSDAQDLKRNINDKTIYRNTLHIPYPYKDKDAQTWIKKCQYRAKQKRPKVVSFVIVINNEVVGSIGLKNILWNHKAELGYWLSRKHWGKGLMTKIVKETLKYGFHQLKLKRIFAFTFPHNKASARVLLKNGFKQEGYLKKNVKKNNRFMDQYLFAITRK